jgi:excisionase family DNA binding protein
MPLSTGGGKGYMNATQAARLMGISPRHVYRLIENGQLMARHKNKRRLEIALTDIEAWVETHPREVDLLEQLKDLREQFQQVCQRLDKMETQFDAFRTCIHEELAALKEEIQRGDLQEALHSLLAMFAWIPKQENQLGRETSADNNSLALPRIHSDLQERIRRSLTALERRQLPKGVVTIASFAKSHGVKPRTAVDHCKKSQIFTQYRRPKAKILKYEWWITPEQQGLLIRIWKQRQFSFVECHQCPHETKVEVSNE